MIKIAPSLLSASLLELEDEIESLQDCGADFLHYDIMDGIFAPNIALGFKLLEDISSKFKIPLDVHFMIIEPAQYIERAIKCGAARLSFHIEARGGIEANIKLIKSLGVKAGLAIRPDTKIETLFPYIKDLDFVIVMGVMPGYSGQKFIPETTEKIKKLAGYIKNNNLKTEIEFDGGLTEDNAMEIKQAGAEVLVTGNTFFQSRNRKKVIKILRG